MAKVKFPKKVEIGGYLVEVVHPYVFEDNTNLYGNFCSGTMTVFISGEENIDNQTLFGIFLHEFIHAIDSVYLGFVLSEDMVDSIARGLLQVFRTNDLNYLDITIDDVPDSLMIGGLVYNIIYPHVFIDHEFENTLSYVPKDLKEIRMADTFNNQEVADVTIRCGLLVGILYSIIEEYHGNSEERLPKGALIPLANGLYQFIKNTKLEERIKRWLN